MVKPSERFEEAANAKVYDLSHRNTINYNIGKYDAAVKRGLSKFVDLEASKKVLNAIKWHTIEKLDEYLIKFESNFQQRGGKVIWANTAEEARLAVLDIAKRNKVSSIVKSKSMVTEEIELNHFLEQQQIKVLETDLGEFIVQLLNQKPYHIVTPAMHLSKKDIAEVFHQKFGTPLDYTPEQLTQKARELLRQEYLNAGIGITGANFLIADTGSISITENEGNARLSTAFPKIHIAIVGIEKMIPSIDDLDVFLPMLASHGTGQNLTVYNTIISGPRQENETDGPEQMYVILLDNGRSKLLAKKEQRQGLYCIRCGACLNACPVYKNIGGHTYGTTYSGPIGSIITPHFKGMKTFKHLSAASSLCGRCTEVCPVKIDIHKMLLLNRKEAAESGINSSLEGISWAFWKRIMLSRKLLDWFGAGTKNRIIRWFFAKKFGLKRSPIQVSNKSYARVFLDYIENYLSKKRTK